MRRLASSDLRWFEAAAIGVIGTSGVDVTICHQPPSPDCAHLVARFWSLSWRVQPGFGGDPTLVALPLPEPLVLMDHKRVMYRHIMRQRCTSSVQEYSGTLYAAALRPGAAAELLGVPLAQHRDEAVPLSDTSWGRRAHRAPSDLQLAAQDGLARFASTFEGHARDSLSLPDDADLLRVHAMLDAVENGGITRVAQLAERFHLSTRTIQRAFCRHVGVTPKWLLRRYRVLHAASLLQRNPPTRWRELAVELDYFDDSHFARDFGGAVGVTPYVFAQSASPASLQTCEEQMALTAHSTTDESERAA